MAKVKNSIYNRKCSNGLNFLLCFLTGIILGTLLGAISINILVSYRVDNFYEKIAYLESVIVDKDDRLEKLEKSINNFNIVVKDIEVILLFEGDEIDNIEISKVIKDKYKLLLGKDLKDIDADLVVQIVDKRIIKLMNANYQLHIQKLIIGEVIKIWVDVTTYNF